VNHLPSPPTLRPTVMGSRYMGSTGHYLATAAAVRILDAGGNAIDAGVGAGLCLNVVQPEFTNLGGVFGDTERWGDHDPARTWARPCRL
jgi:gamma-glutamyltranspeptidase